MTTHVLPPQCVVPTTVPGASGDAFLASGSSPTVHVIGLGKVGRALLACLDNEFRVVGASDRSATCYARDGIDRAAVIARKRGRGRLLDDAGARAVPLRVAVSIVGADFVVDCTDTDLASAGNAATQALAALDSGTSLVFASKAALSGATSELLQPSRRRRLGINAVLGGTGRALLDELDLLRRRCTRAVLVPNATTTCIIREIERGASFDDAVASAQRRGFAEADVSADLDGRDAAAKLAIVANAVFGLGISHERVTRPSLTDLDFDLLRARHGRGQTTRLVARIERDAIALRYEAVARGSTLAVPQTRVVYAYELGAERRVHVGAGIGARGTAEAIRADLRALCAGGQ